ncbi:hypothetical protein [Dactylosporangium sp. NPDC051541]|uniref:hypothetical protein n=1 Tax=Dactylosporangium sp. NPDC051541 TaxID=3363977 RepID=UPI00378AE646
MSSPWQNIRQSQQNAQTFSRIGQQASANASYQAAQAARRANAGGRPARSAIGGFFRFVFGLIALVIGLGIIGVIIAIAAEVMQRSGS